MSGRIRWARPTVRRYVVCLIGVVTVAWFGIATAMVIDYLLDPKLAPGSSALDAVVDALLASYGIWAPWIVLLSFPVVFPAYLLLAWLVASLRTGRTAAVHLEDAVD